MTRFGGTDAEGDRIVGVGITVGTYAKLLQGEIMVLPLAELGVSGVKLMIVAGPDEVAIAHRLKDNMSSRTNVDLHPGLITKP